MFTGRLVISLIEIHVVYKSLDEMDTGIHVSESDQRRSEVFGKERGAYIGKKSLLIMLVLEI